MSQESVLDCESFLANILFVHGMRMPKIDCCGVCHGMNNTYTRVIGGESINTCCRISKICILKAKNNEYAEDNT